MISYREFIAEAAKEYKPKDGVYYTFNYTKFKNLERAQMWRVIGEGEEYVEDETVILLLMRWDEELDDWQDDSSEPSYVIKVDGEKCTLKHINGKVNETFPNSDKLAAFLKKNFKKLPV